MMMMCTGQGLCGGSKETNNRYTKIKGGTTSTTIIVTMIIIRTSTSRSDGRGWSRRGRVGDRWYRYKPG
jgi:hypothetical protein